MTLDPRMVPELIETTGDNAGRTHPLPYGEHVLGRGTESSIVLDDKDVSRRHARLDVGPEGVTLHDLGSKNGIQSGGRRLTTPHVLTHGQSFAFGDLELTVSHPPSQVKGVLSAAGETTITASSSQTQDASNVGFVLLPIIGVLLFGALVVALLMV